ncbi:hypothetical protein B0J17DRAFT_685837 [Rhizoctonia solani]|nr:hypothetical protein B0J17DRAFT_685837 [Rhizoctonia solani]
MALIIGTNSCSRKWNNTPKHVDPEDSRVVMSAYIKQLSDDRDPLAIARDPSVAPSFVPLAIDAQTQDLLPAAMQCTIKYAWCALLDEEEADKLKALVDVISGSLSMLIQPPHNQPYDLTVLTQTRILDEINQTNLLDWSSCAMIRLRPASKSTLASLYRLFRTLSEIVPHHEIEMRLHDYAPEWHKFRIHLSVAGFVGPASSFTSRQQLYDTCLNAWFKISQILRLESTLLDYNRAIPT